MNDEIREILDNIKKDIKGKFEWEYIDGYYVEQIKPLLDYITNLQEENERLKNNQVKALNRIKDFIKCSKCEIIEGNYCDTKHSQYWKMFKKFVEELKDKIKGIDTNDYVYIPKEREQELLSQEEQLEEHKARIDKAVEYLTKIRKTSSYELDEKIDNLEDILNGGDEE